MLKSFKDKEFRAEIWEVTKGLLKIVFGIYFFIKVGQIVVQTGGKDTMAILYLAVGVLVLVLYEKNK